MKKIRQLVFAILFLLPLMISAQDLITGNVKDDQGIDLPGVSVMIQGTTQGTATDFDGNFELEADADAVLVFSYVGYSNVELPVSANMQVVMQESAESLDEVVLIGYGQTTKKDATGAVERVGEKEFNVGAIASPEQLITGKTAGVNVTPPSGRPGETGTVKIRGGISSLSNNDPLYVIDGVPIDQKGPALNSINPSDIESFNILKDASATAIYGSRATNGVIIITTKSGKMNSDFRVEIDSKFSSGVKSNTIDNLNTAEFRAAINSTQSQNAQDLLTNFSTNWQDQVYQTAFGTDNNLILSEGFDNSSYRVAFGYTYQGGILKTGKFSRPSVSMNFRQNLFDNSLKMDFNLRGSWVQERYADQGSIGTSVAFDPTKPVYSGQPEFGGYWEWLNDDGSVNTLAPRNPLGLLMQNQDNGNTQRYIGNAKFDYKFGFLEGLNLVVNLGFDYSEYRGSFVVPAESAAGFNDKGSVRDYSGLKRNTLADVYLNYVNTFAEKHKVDVMLGHSFQDFYREDRNVTQDGLGSPATGNFRLVSLNALESLFARANYTFDERYLVTFTYRRDGSSRFAPENRWADFYSGALAWNISEEDFLKDSDVLSTLKLRLGFGQTGQQEIDKDFGYLPIYTPGDAGVRYPFGSDYHYTLRPEGYDKNIKWEESETYNIGIDFGFMNDRLSGSVEYFKRESSDILSTIAPPAGSNLTNNLYTNIGDLSSEGVEFTINADIFQKENFTWNVNFNATWLNNEIKKLNNFEDPLSPGIAQGEIGGGVGNTIQTHKVGYPQFSYLVYEQVYDTSGMPLEGVYVDQNNDGVINDSDKRIYKNPNPDYLMGFSSYMNFHNFDLSFTLRASLGNYAYNNVSSATGYYGALYELGTLRNIHSSINDTEFNTQQLWSDYYIQDASFLRMDNISLGYTFDNLKDGDVGFRLYTTVQNVFVLTEYEGLDPEISGGIDNNFYPRPRTFLLGFNINF
ncbi:SusC/RagA family TonB-linked outer membrane protein [Lutimonas vermicola]|uniref:SusC/RagA family TonB-linked outer membrane protein n=1 Tax=Lutimonas vermicola TaxID=414288 RepID=A0ABU9L6T5_9FLAO